MDREKMATVQWPPPRMAAKPSTPTLFCARSALWSVKAPWEPRPFTECGELDAVLQLSPIRLVLVLDGLVRSKTREFEDEPLVRRLDLILVVTPVVEAMTRAPSAPSA